MFDLYLYTSINQTIVNHHWWPSVTRSFWHKTIHIGQTQFVDLSITTWNLRDHQSFEYGHTSLQKPADGWWFGKPRVVLQAHQSGALLGVPKRRTLGSQVLQLDWLLSEFSLSTELVCELSPSSLPCSLIQLSHRFPKKHCAKWHLNGPDSIAWRKTRLKAVEVAPTCDEILLQRGFQQRVIPTELVDVTGWWLFCGNYALLKSKTDQSPNEFIV